MSSASAAAWRRIHNRISTQRMASVGRRRLPSRHYSSNCRVAPLLLSNCSIAPPLPQHRWYHSSTWMLDETKELSAKEKKKLMKAKAKEAMAEKEKEEEDSSDSSSDDESSNTKDDKTASKSKEDKFSESAKENTPAPSAATTAEVITDGEAVKEYSYAELTADAAKHKAGMEDPTRPEWQNPLHHNNPEMEKCYPEDFDSPEEFEKAVLPAPPIDPGDGSVVAPPHIHKVVDEIVHLTMLEYNELINKIADHYGFHESDLAPDDGDGGDDDDFDGAAGAAAEEKTAFDIKLVSFDAKAKIKIIKEVRTIVTGLGLKEAKALVEGAPIVLQKGVNKEDAEAVKAKLEELGAVIEVA